MHSPREGQSGFRPHAPTQGRLKQKALEHRTKKTRACLKNVICNEYEDSSKFWNVWISSKANQTAKTLSPAQRPNPRVMKWRSNGELAGRDLDTLIQSLLDVESPNHSHELSRLHAKETN